MSSTISYSMDDKDLDDAALWAVIDSAAASHSVSSAKSCRPLAIRYPNFQSPPTPISHLSPPQKLPQNPKRHYQPHQNQYSSPQAKEAPETHHQRPHKIARSCTSEMSETASPLVLVGRMQRTPIATTTFSSPESYLSPGIGRFRNGSEASPAGSCLRSEENDTMRHSLSGSFPSVSLFKDYQDAAMAILEKSDYTMISGNPYIKKSGWRKISFYFNLSYEIKDKTIEFDENRNVQRAEFVVRAYMQGGRFSDGWGSCDRREKKFIKPNHDIPSTAETRAKNKACQDLLGIGEYRPGLSQFQR